ncbi:MAG: MBL fold metallo-hydrolase [Proteobacteria bacterium]|nr:MBL fold metallo-hydrolase [Pseudomonadota bacterium]MBU4472054.1 MBL fold metallo-hydrolase [Pseudomonadota bacterium]MCG2752947.1 MBL fold metallo-hydrolase [Desulfobacteraceae bacterium]
MLKFWILLAMAGMLFPLGAMASQAFPTDTLETASGPVEITLVGHGTLMLKFNNTVIHIDPWTRLADYTLMPKADLILVTHGHADHFDPTAIEDLRKDNTQILLPAVCAEGIKGGKVMANGETLNIDGLIIEAMPAYNIVNMRKENTPYHPKGEGNGYVITFSDKRVYVAGDTENTPEMKALKNIDAAFLPMNLPYTMSPEMAADAIKAFKPKVVYPYHYGAETMAGMGDMLKTELEQLLKDEKGSEIRVPVLK